MIYQQINNSKNKISINELIANNIELKHKKRNNNVLNLKERAMIKKNNSINSINNSINECEKIFVKSFLMYINNIFHSIHFKNINKTY